MKQLLILTIILMATTKGYPQQLNLGQASEALDFFKTKIEIPEGYAFETVDRATVDGKETYLFRFEKAENKGLGGEHFSFLVSESKPFTILGFTQMDKKYSGAKQLSKSEAGQIAQKFLQRLDPTLYSALENKWIAVHDETIVINGEKSMVSGMKYKCYDKTADAYAWVIVGGDGSVMTFERNIPWDYDQHKRISEKHLHDAWLEEQERSRIAQLLEAGFVNGPLNRLDTDKMRELFHPDFAILMPKGEKMNRLPLTVWIDIIEQYKQTPEKRNSGLRAVECKLGHIDITGKTAMVKAQLYRQGILISTDYITLLKFETGWKAVSKVSNEHIVNPFNL